MDFDMIIRTMFGGMEKLGPGDDEITRKALLALPRRARETVVDAGCGAGRQTLVLADALRSVIDAVDTFAPFLDSLRQRARAHGLERFVRTHCMDMRSIPVHFPSIDLLWSESAAYSIGFIDALRSWRPSVRRDGFVVVSELVWMRTDVPDDTRAFFADEYPDMRVLSALLAEVGHAGYEVLDTATLPPASWEAGYYDVLRDRADALAEHPDADMRRFAEQTVREIAVFDRSHECYGYVLLTLRPIS